MRNITIFRARPATPMSRSICGSGAVTIGHFPPPLRPSTLPDALRRLEHLLDEYSTADGLDPARRQRLIASIRDEARAAGLEDDFGIAASAAPAEAIPRIDRFVC